MGIDVAAWEANSLFTYCICISPIQIKREKQDRNAQLQTENTEQDKLKKTKSLRDSDITKLIKKTQHFSERASISFILDLKAVSSVSSLGFKFKNFKFLLGQIPISGQGA